MTAKNTPKGNVRQHQELPKQQILPPFEGKSVIKSTMRITKAGDGLSDALDLEPLALHLGDVQFYVVEVEVTQVNHKTDSKTDTATRVHTAEVRRIAAIADMEAEAMLEQAAADMRQRRRDAARAQGKEELPMPEGGEVDKDTDPHAHLEVVPDPDDDDEYFDSENADFDSENPAPIEPDRLGPVGSPFQQPEE